LETNFLRCLKEKAAGDQVPKMTCKVENVRLNEDPSTNLYRSCGSCWNAPRDLANTKMMKA